MKKISIIIPVYNEEDSIENNLKLILETLNEDYEIEYTILVIDDGSKDSTVEKIKSLSHHYDNLELLCLTRNFVCFWNYDINVENASRNVERG